MEREEPIIPRFFREKVPMGPIRSWIKDNADEVHFNAGPLGITWYMHDKS